MHNSMHLTAKNSFKQTEMTTNTKNQDKFVDQQIKGIMGSTWDAKHMSTFLNRSFYSNKKSPQKDQKNQKNFRKASSTMEKKGQTQDYFFKNLRYDMNTSHIGFTKVNPLVSNIQVSKQKQQTLRNFFKTRTQKLQKSSFYSTQNQNNGHKKSPILRCSQDSKFRFQSNTIKFKSTDPLTNQYQPQKSQKIGFSLQRMKRQIHTRYQHGIVGIDHPTNIQTVFYQSMNLKSPNVREIPMSQQSFLLSRDWKTKKRTNIPQTQLQPLQQNLKRTQCIRKLRNQNIHGYNILTNRIVDQ